MFTNIMVLDFRYEWFRVPQMNFKRFLVILQASYIGCSYTTSCCCSHVTIVAAICCNEIEVLSVITILYSTVL